MKVTIQSDSWALYMLLQERKTHAEKARRPPLRKGKETSAAREIFHISAFYNFDTNEEVENLWKWFT